MNCTAWWLAGDVGESVPESVSLPTFRVWEQLDSLNEGARKNNVIWTVTKDQASSGNCSGFVQKAYPCAQ